MMEIECFMRKVLPALSPAEFTYLTLEEKKEWVLAAVLLSHSRQVRAQYKLYQYPTDGKRETEGLDGKSFRQEDKSETIIFDLTGLSIEESKNEKCGSRNRVFQLFSACVYFRTDKPGLLYGAILAKGSGCSEYISFFNRGESESQLIFNNGLVSLTDPSPYGLISATGMVKMKVQLFVRLNDDDLKLSLVKLFWDSSKPYVNKYFNHFENVVIKEKDGYVKLYYMVLDHPVEATVEVVLETNYSFNACGKIVAYYGDLDSYFLPHDESDYENEGLESGTFKCGIEEAGYCKITLFEASRFDPVLVQDGKIPLIRSKLVVPNGGSLVIEADLEDLRLRHRNVKGTYKFRSKLCGRSTGLINGLRCMMALKVDWKHDEE